MCEPDADDEYNNRFQVRDCLAITVVREDDSTMVDSDRDAFSELEP